MAVLPSKRGLDNRKEKSTTTTTTTTRDDDETRELSYWAEKPKLEVP
jgi:hypothetical protein